jgi:hypothetical protein
MVCCVVRFFSITFYIGDTHNVHTHPYEHTRVNPTPRNIFQDWADKSSRLTKSPEASRCRLERHLPLKAQAPLNPDWRRFSMHRVLIVLLEAIG